MVEEWKVGMVGWWRSGIALGSCGEFHSCYVSFQQAHQISAAEFEKLDELHFKVENELLKLVESRQKKQRSGQWEDTFHQDS